MKVRAVARHVVSSVLASLLTVALATSAIAAPIAAEDIRDIRGPILIPAWWRWPAAAAVVVLTALAVASAIRWWRRRHRQLSPIERAREALARAAAEAQAGRSHEWAEIVAGTLRDALAARIGLAILPKTTSELAQADWTKPPLAVELDAAEILTLLERCDVARFARATFETETLVASTAAAREVTERLFAPARRTPPPPSSVAETVTP